MDLPEGYAQVAVLIIKWDERIDELKCAEEVNELEALFRDDFHYETNIISLDEKSSPHHQLIHAMSGFLRKFDGPNNLLIIYYTGHAGYNKENGELEFSARTNSAAASNASWNVAETLFLKGTQADTLAILDTCYASNITKGAEYTGRAYQLLAASAYDRMTAGPGHKSFTNAMIESLRECLVENSQAPFSLWKLSTKINEKQYRRKNPCIPHDRLKKHDRQIFLAPLKENKGKREENRKVLSERTGVADLTLRFALGTTSLTRERIERLSKELPKACNAADVKLCSIDWVGFERRPVNFAAAVRAFSYARRWLRMTRGKKEDLPQKGSVANPTGIDNVRDPAHQEATSIRALVINALSLEPEADLEVCSLATNPVERSSRVATIVFQDVPPPLSGNPRNQWVVPLPNIDDDDGDARGSPRKPLVFDTHFAGFTPLQHADEEDCHIE
ncbi:homeobox domain containing protein [Botryosphaeria dothidea]|uniref:Homeobox domain containing protein n=1 Tax=Botryosphaeria dothidea TaxID=55169 RepID=A0A8H4J3S4_9PEZI|nr:homeobox domain containing protein [Botryosphaeria dothidea]